MPVLSGSRAAPPTRLVVFPVALAALATASCPVVDRASHPRRDPAPAVFVKPPAAPEAPAAAALVPAALPGGDWPEPSAEQIARLTNDATTHDRVLVALAKETFVFERPSWGSNKIGYLRAGAIVPRGADPVGRAACAEGWYRIEPSGFVCVGRMATLDPSHPIALLSRTRADTAQPLPYRYGMSRFPTPPFYTKLPSPNEQQRVEADLAGHRSQKRGDAWADAPVSAIPSVLENGHQLPMPNGEFHGEASLYSGRAMVKSGFALLDVYDDGGRKFGLSVDLDLMPLDRLEPVQPSAFQGLELDAERSLPVAFIRQKGATLYAGHPQRGLRAERVLAYREPIALGAGHVSSGGIAYLETRDGHWLRDENLTIVPPMSKRPGWAAPGRTWIDISILRQSLVAYEGERPVYVTLVSTGADGLGDPTETHSTIRGQFLIHTKHVTATMSGDELGDEFDLRDVPYVQYFTEGYALHAAYWHESFGRPRSHGCVNLSPVDARWLFQWTDPPVPENWHGAMSLREGTLVYIHP